MGFFGKGDQEARRRFGTTIVAEGSELVGELILQGKLHVDGVIRGSIRTEGNVTVGRSGVIEGDVSASHVVVSGKVTGNVLCESLEVVALGTVVGDVTSGEFIVEKGAHFEGENHSRANAQGDGSTQLKPVSPNSGPPAPKELPARRVEQDRPAAEPTKIRL